MPVRLRIATFFTLLSVFILGVVCLFIYYISSVSRQQNLSTRLYNRALTTARLLTHAGNVDRVLMYRIDSLTALSLTRKSVQVYDEQNQPDYFYSDLYGDTVRVSAKVLEAAREKGRHYFRDNGREAVAAVDTALHNSMLVVSAGLDEEGYRQIEKLRSILLLSFVAGVLLSFLGGYLFSAGLLQPVKRIANEVKDISTHNLGRRIPVSNVKDEWQLLSSNLNELLDRLKDGFELQRRFISNASHELSTPLTLISSQLEISLQRNRTEEAYREAMMQVLKDVQHMNSLVQTLLQFATASGNPGGLHIGLARIDEILMRLPGEIQTRDKQHHVSLHFGPLPEDDNRLLVLGNEELLFTAILNIVTNACKYTPTHHAEVTLEVTPTNFTIQVKDEGAGIAPEELERIFQPFYRIQRENGVKGFGLGLSLATRIVKLHKGDITASSVPGAGTIFTILLPAGQ